MFIFSLALPAGAPPNATYESWINKIANGDKNALGLLYEQTRDAVYGFALSILHNAHEAEDVLQDTFVSVFASAGSYKSMGKPMAWMLTITRNLSLMKIRQRQKLVVLPEEEWNLFTAEAAVSSEDKLLLTAALESISPEESQIVMLHAVAGFKHREIAEFLELPLSTVLSRYNRAIKKLKSTLKEAGAYEK